MTTNTQPNWAPDQHCQACAHFGGWPPELEGRVAWCLHSKRMNALPKRGCSSWTAQPPGWVAPPPPGATPGLVPQRRR